MDAVGVGSESGGCLTVGLSLGEGGDEDTRRARTRQSDTR